MIDQVVGIVTEVRNKLLYRAVQRFHIVDYEEMEDEIEYSVGDYRAKSSQFDRFIYCMWKYLDMLTRTSQHIEDLYLSLLEILDLPRPNKFTIFRAVHW